MMRKSKSKNLYNPRRIFLKVLLTLIAIPTLFVILCYGFARFGGELASSHVLPIHPESKYIDSNYYYVSSEYRMKRTFYYSDLSPMDLREWYIANNISLTPLMTIRYTNDGTKAYNDEIKYDGYYGTTPLFDTTNLFQSLHQISAYMFGGWSEYERSCQGVRVYFDNEMLNYIYPEIIVDSSSTVYLVSTCWLRVD